MSLPGSPSPANDKLWMSCFQLNLLRHGRRPGISGRRGSACGWSWEHARRWRRSIRVMLHGPLREGHGLQNSLQLLRGFVTRFNRGSLVPAEVFLRTGQLHFHHSQIVQSAHNKGPRLAGAHWPRPLARLRRDRLRGRSRIGGLRMGITQAQTQSQRDARYDQRFLIHSNSIITP